MNKEEQVVADALLRSLSEIAINNSKIDTGCDKTLYGKVVEVGNRIKVLINDVETYCKIKEGVSVNINDGVIVVVPNGNNSKKYIDGRIKNIPSVSTDVNARFVIVPTGSAATGKKGDISADSDYLYICYNTNQWIRIAKSTW